jgi:hypothetical protein
MSKSNDALKQFLTDGVPVSHPTDAQLLDWTTRIQSGERGNEIDGIARYIIKDFRLRQMLGVQQSPITMDWLGSALDALIGGDDIGDAFGLRSRPNKRPRDLQKDMDIATWVSVAQTRGHKKSEAKILASEVFHTDLSNIRRKVASTSLSWINPDTDFWEQYFIEQGRPLPPVKKSGRK